MKQNLFLIITITTLVKIYGQEKRTVVINETQINYYAYSSETYKLPNFKANIYLVNKDEPLPEPIKKDSVSAYSPESKKYFNYYLSIPSFKKEKEQIRFLKDFVETIFNNDFIDRNTVTLYNLTSDNYLNCSMLETLNEFIANIVVDNKSPLLHCDSDLITTVEQENKNKVTSVNYKTLTIKESEETAIAVQVINKLGTWKNTYFITVTTGYHHINNRNRVVFEEETLVDLGKLNTTWSLNAGYAFSNKFAGLLNFTFLYNKDISKDITDTDIGTKISGTGNGAGVFKLGVGLRYIAYVKERWSAYSELSWGLLSVKAGGGSGYVTIDNGSISGSQDQTEKKERTTYTDITLGANYRLGEVMFLNSNIQYTFSKFKNDIGSVNGFSGITLNLGLGFCLN